MRPHLCVGIDVGCKSHRVGIARPNGLILEEFDISHTDAGFQEFFRRGYGVTSGFLGHGVTYPNSQESELGTIPRWRSEFPLRFSGLT